jgi:hypothetical protein
MWKSFLNDLDILRVLLFTTITATRTVEHGLGGGIYLMWKVFLNDFDILHVLLLL